MKIEWYEPSARFDVTSFSNVSAGPLTTIYACSRCGTKLGFTKDNFEVRAARRFTNLSADVASALDEAATKRGFVTHAFLDWLCTGCGLAVRAYARAWAGGCHGDGGVDIVGLAEVTPPLSIDPEITERIPRVLRYLKARGFFVVKSEFSSSYFGNFLVYLSSWRRMIRIINDRGQFFGEIWSWKLRWESIEGYLERKGVPVDDLHANLTDEDRLLALLARLIER